MESYVNLRAGNGAEELLLGATATGGIVTTSTNHDLQLGANNSAVLTISPAGNVGIGTTTPEAPLHVAGYVAVGPFSATDGQGGIDVTGPVAELGFVRRSLTSWPSAAAPGDRFVWYNPDGSARLWTHEAGDLLTVTSNGNLGVGTTAPTGKLDVHGDIRAGNSDIYFTKADHNHTGIGNAVGHAAIENAADYGALMILGRAATPRGRTVKLWDYLQVNGDLDVTGRINGQLAVLNVAPSFTAAIRCADLLIGGIGDRGPERRALVAWSNQLEINHNRDWPTCVVNGFASGSSREHKDNIEAMELADAKNHLQALTPVEFSACSDEEARRLCGFIAEETPAMLASKGQKGIYLDGILAVLTKVVQAQEKELEQLRAQVAWLAEKPA